MPSANLLEYAEEYNRVRADWSGYSGVGRFLHPWRSAGYANAVKSIAKDSLDLVLVTSDLEWIHERRVRDAIANEWVYSALSLSSALISISKLWAKTLRV